VDARLASRVGDAIVWAMACLEGEMPLVFWDVNNTH